MNWLGPKDIKNGQIVLYHIGDERVCKLIMKLTESDVAHAALVVKQGKAPEVAEETSKGVRQSPILFKDGDQYYAYVKEMNEALDMKPVLQRAEFYVEQKDGFAFGRFVMLLMIFLLRKLPVNHSTKLVLYTIITHVASKVITAINDAISKGKKPMTCSQFVYACFNEAAEKTKNKKYRLQVSSEFQARGSDEFALLDRVADYRASRRASKEKVNIRSISFDEGALNEAIDNYLAALDKQDETTRKEIAAIDDTEILNVLSDAAEKIYQANIFNLEVPTARGSVDRVMEYFKYCKEYFVTPADLKDHCSNTSILGKIRAKGQ